MSSLSGSTLFISGASRGIGLAIAIRAARDGANIAIAAKTGEPHARLEGTIYTAASAIEAAGGKALPILCDIRSDEQVQAAIDLTVKTFGGIDVVVNNASAISLTGTLDTTMKKFDLMNQVNARGTFLVSRTALPHLLASKKNPHILTLSPPLDMQQKWFAPHVAYSMAKFGMSMVTLGLAGELEGQVAVNSLWPRTTIATAAVNMLGGEELMKASRSTDIMSDAAYAILTKGVDFSGHFLVDEDFLRTQGVTDFKKYNVDPNTEPTPDFFVD